MPYRFRLTYRPHSVGGNNASKKDISYGYRYSKMVQPNEGFWFHSA